MAEEASIFVGGGGAGHAMPQQLLLRYGNRHGLIAGATGTGKTVTLQGLAEGFSAEGVPVFLADVKGDLSGLAAAGSATHKLHDTFAKRATTIGFDLQYRAYPVTFWDMFGQQGHPIRATVAEMGPLLLSRLLEQAYAAQVAGWLPEAADRYCQAARLGQQLMLQPQIVQNGPGNAVQAGAVTSPLATVRGYLSAGFGNRKDPFTGLPDFHPGLDISAPLGTKILAPADGTVKSKS